MTCILWCCMIFFLSVVFGHGRAVAINCFNEMNKENNITHLLLNVKTQTQFDQFCRRMNTQMRCIASYEHYLSTSENTHFLQLTNGIHQYFLIVCPPGTDLTEDYKANANCLEYIKREITVCGAILPSTKDLDILNRKRRCCNLKNYRNCLLPSVKAECGEDVTSVIAELLDRYFKTFTSDCETYNVFDCNRASEDNYPLEKRSPSKWEERHWPQSKWHDDHHHWKHKKGAANKDSLSVALWYFWSLYLIISMIWIN